MLKNIFLTFLIINGIGLFARNKLPYLLRNLTQNGRPPLSDVKQFVRNLKQKAEHLLRSQLGNYYYDLLVDQKYKYRWYYDNVYFNKALTEMNYRVLIRLNISKKLYHQFELKFDEKTLELILGIDKYIPNCKVKQAKCIFMNISNSKLSRNPRFSYSPYYKTFIWTYMRIRGRNSYHKHIMKSQIIRIIDANDGKVLFNSKQ